MKTASAKFKLGEAIASLHGKTGVSLALPDEEGIVAFSFKQEGTALDFYMRALDDADMVSIMVPIGQVDEAALAGFAEALLGANLLGLETNGLSLGLNPGDRSVVLGYSVFSKGLTGEVLEEVIGRFVVAGKEWKERLQP
ncbi:MAG: type III secretion system chaperone [Byssovorax sp.]